MALNSLFCADVPLSNYSLTHSLSLSLCVCVCVCVCVCGITYGLRKNKTWHEMNFRFTQFNSLFDHAKYTSNMAARFYVQFSDATSPLL